MGSHDIDATLAAAIAALAESAAGGAASAEERRAAAAGDGLPVHGGVGGWLVLRRSGDVVRYEPTTDTVHPVPEPGWRRLAHLRASEMFPALRALAPRRPANAVRCAACDGAGSLLGNLVCGTCYGVGWVDPPAARDGGYAEVFRALGLSEVALDLALDRATMPSPALYPPFPAAGGPPALVPIWVDPVDLEYAGYWQHFFVPRRRTLVRCSGADRFAAFEIARSAEQLFSYACVEALCNMGGPTAEIERFAAATGLDLGALDRLAAKVGDRPAELSRYPPFTSDPPLAMVGSDLSRYRGDFPVPGASPGPDALLQCCSLEFAVEERESLARDPSAPAWFSHPDLPGLFEDLLDARQYSAAWLTLNSSGWSLERAKAAIRALAAATGDPGLGAVAAAWCAQPHRRMSSY